MWGSPLGQSRAQRVKHSAKCLAALLSCGYVSSSPSDGLQKVREQWIGRQISALTVTSFVVLRQAT